jgi:hypothetical protein
MEAAFKELIKKLKSIHTSQYPDERYGIRDDWEPIRAYLAGDSDELYVSSQLTELTESVGAFREANKNFSQRLQMADRDIDNWINGQAGGGRRRRATKKRRVIKRRTRRHR